MTRRLTVAAVTGALVGALLLPAPALAADPATTDLVISEYVEGTSFNKAIELYNGTGGPLSLADLEFRLYSNGRPLADGPTSTYDFPATTLADGDVFVVVNPQFNDDEGFTLGGDVDDTSGAINFNGDDAFTIVDTSDDSIVDSFGQVGVRTTYGQDVTLRRTDLTPDTDPTDPFDAATQWASFATNDVSDLGIPPSGDGGGGEPPEPEPVCDTPDEELTLISEVQGSDADPDARFDSPLDGQEVTIRGVVTLADTDLRGYFVQEEPADDDGDPSSSEGLFVFQSAGALPVEGETVELTDEVTAFFGLTQLSFPDTEVCDVPLVTIEPTPITLPLDRNGREALEGMLVTNAQDLEVTGLFTAYRFGELGLAFPEPLPQPTSVFTEDDPRVFELTDLNAASELIVNDRNEAFGQFNPYPWELFDEDLSAGDTMPAGRLVGALGYSFGEYKVEPLDNEVGDPSARIFFPETDDTFTIPDVPALTEGNDVAAFNVLNYFNTFGDSDVLRGARSQEQFDLQSAKIVDAINTLDAAVLGLVEIENDYEDLYDGDDSTEASIVTLVGQLNADAGYEKWAFVAPGEDILTDEGLGGGGLGPDAIAVGIIYQPDRARPLGTPATFDIDALLTGDDEDNNRWPLAQTFQVEGPAPDVTVVVNHFKSKGSPCTDTAGPGFGLGDDVENDLNGGCSLVRQYAAERLLEWLDTRPTGADHDRNLVVGDLNSYEEEDPILLLEDAGYVDLVDTLGDDASTFKFDGRYGRLDYVMASPDVAKFVKDAEVWQVNSPAPYGYLYFNDPQTDDYPLFWASSDHDPVVVSLGPPGRRR